MATAPAQTFQDLTADPDVAAAVAAANVPVTGRVKRDLGADVGGVLDTLVIIDDNNLLKGVCMTSSGPAISTQKLVVRPTILGVVVDQVATIQTTTVEAEYTQQLMESNYTAVSVKASAPYVTANADYSQDTSYKNTQTDKTVMVSSRFMFPQGRVDFNSPLVGVVDPVQLSPAFTSAITGALGQSTTTAQREALDAVFNQFGHVFRTKVRLGGALSAHTMETFSRTESESTVKQDINTETTVTTKQGRTLDVKYIVNGGDYTLIQKTDSWITSTTDSSNWRVIEVTEVTPVVDMLPDNVKSQVQKLMTPLLGQWVSTMQTHGTAPFSGVSLYQPKDPIPAGWFFLGYTTDSSQALLIKPTLPAKTGRNVAVAPPKLRPVTFHPFLPRPLTGTNSGNLHAGLRCNLFPEQQFGAVRPGLFIEGTWKAAGSADAKAYTWVIHPNTPQAPEDDCFDLQTVAWQWSSDGQTPLYRYVLRKNAVLFNSGET
ncbi:hypothetical protein C8T65DRAFT_745785 [Cerioporus squamosus]|nr:hypothetical protein C8T65DRAFT_745785 [Cerioporus squamosus]